MGWGAVIFVSLFVGIASQIGDFCESFFKRAFDKKDSGSILPGHGGFLDRFDGVVFSLPIMYACTRIFS
jgi:phosphatidate cytidylyltransferase